MSALVAVSVALGACSGGGSSPAASSTSSTSSSSAPSSASGSSTPTTLKDVKGAAKALSDFSCKATGKSWNATGKLANTTKSTMTYQIRVAVVKPKSFTVVGTKKQDFVLSAGKTVDVKFDQIYTGPGDGLMCIPSVVTGK